VPGIISIIIIGLGFEFFKGLDNNTGSHAMM